ncbi:MAG TPA: PilX N-terminal domain-containing pilus assembly protein [Cellvibrio sp.]|nr:PilX N-terminal domain-containing pilus assembly protein [Cellvibrio sp.]
MKCNYAQPVFAAPAKQQGMVLIVGLVMVLLLTIIGVAAIRGSGLQESMAANMRDSNLAFQTAESALRACEADLNPSLATLPDDNKLACNHVSDLNVTPALSIMNNEANRVATSRVMNIDLYLKKEADEKQSLKIAAQPLGLVERMQNDRVSYAALHGLALGVQGARNQIPVDSYRVTVSAVGLSDSTQVILQSTYYR